MAGSQLWGFQAGQRIAEQDIQQKRMNDLALMQGQQNLALGEIKIDSEKVALEAAKSTKDRQETLLRFLDEDGKKGVGGEEELQSAVKSQTTSLTDRLRKLSEFSLQAGLPEQATKYAKEASEIDNNASLIQDRDVQNRLKLLNVAAGLLDKVSDERTFKQANLMYELETGQPSPFKDLDYSPELVQQVKDSVTSQRQKNLIKATEAGEELKNLQEQEAKGRIALNKARTSLTKVREDNLKKVGGVGAIAKSEDVRAITDMLTRDFGGAGLPEDFRIAARPVADRAVSLAKQENLTKVEAYAKAYQEAKEAGDFGGFRVRKPTRGNFKNPIENPKTKEELKPNLYYKMSTGKFAGQILLWDGEQFKIPDPKKLLEAEDREVTEEDEDEEDEE